MWAKGELQSSFVCTYPNWLVDSNLAAIPPWSFSLSGRMAITKAEAFLAVLEKSELLNTEQFAEAQDATLLTNDAAELADLLIRQEMITPWQAGQLLAGRSSLFLGNYALMDLLGRGGMGSVFLARHRTMNRRVALKVVSKKVGKDPASLERFLAEARSIAALDHPNIVRAYDVGQESDRFYIVMEYVEGQDLDVIVREQGLFGYEDVADCIRQAADGLAHAHSRNMIHCDIKPSNLLLSDQGTIKILDMGMARLAGDEDSSEHHQHKMLGTVDYMSPEQAMEGPDFDHRSDIYSLGCTLYFLLTGRPPFDGGTLTQRIVKHQTQEPDDILELHPDAPRELADICKKMMAKNPDDRYQSAEEVGSRLAAWLESGRSGESTSQAQAAASKPADEEPSIKADAHQPAASLAIEELKDAKEAVAGPVLVNKKRRAWSEEQQTVILVAAAVFFAVVVLSVALVAMRFRNEPVETPNTPLAHSEKAVSTEKPKSEDSGPTETVAPVKPPTADKTAPPSPAPAATPKPANTQTPRKTTARPTPATPDKGLIKPGKPKPATPKKPESDPRKPSPKKPAAKQPEPTTPKETKPKPADPFRELPAAVDLELLPATARHPVAEPYPSYALASLHPKAGSVIKVKLLGGEAAIPGNGRFSLMPVENGPKETEWLVKFEADSQQSVDVARIRFAQGVLSFGWLENAIAAEANQLKNCALEITIDGKSRVLQLSKPLFVPPITVDLASGESSQTISRGYLPESDNLRLLVSALEGPVESICVKPKKVVKANGRADIDLHIGKANHIIVRISYSLKGGQTKVDVEYFGKLDGQDRLIPLKTSEWKKLEKQFIKSATMKKRLEAEIAKQKRASTMLSRKKQQLEAMNKRLEEATIFLKFLQAVQNNGQIHFREFIEAEGSRIETANTDTPSEDKKEGQ